MRVFRVESYNGKDGWITQLSQKPDDNVEGNTNLIEVDKETYDLFEEDENNLEIVGSPDSVKKCPRLQSDGSIEMESTGTAVPPEPSEAMQEIVAYYASLNQDADDPTKAGRIQLNQFTSAYPSAQMALQSGDYDELMGSGGYFEIAVEDSDLPDFDSAMRTDLEDILQGKTSYL